MSKRSRQERKEKASLIEIKITPPSLTGLMGSVPCVVCGSRESLRHSGILPNDPAKCRDGSGTGQDPPGSLQLMPELFGAGGGADHLSANGVVEAATSRSWDLAGERLKDELIGALFQKDAGAEAKTPGQRPKRKRKKTYRGIAVPLRSIKYVKSKQSVKSKALSVRSLLPLPVSAPSASPGNGRPGVLDDCRGTRMDSQPGDQKLPEATETSTPELSGVTEATDPPELTERLTTSREKAKAFHRLCTEGFHALEPYIHPQGIGKKMLDSKSGQMVPKHIFSKTRILKFRLGQISPKSFFQDEFSRRTVAANEKGDLRYYVSFPIVWFLYLDNDPPGHAEHRKTGRPYTAEELKDAELTRQWLKKQISKYVFEAADGRLYLKCRLDLTQPLPPKLFQDLAKALNAANPYKSTIEIKGTPRSQRSAGCLARLPVFGNIAKVEEFKAVPEVNVGWLMGWIGTLEEMAPEVKVKKVLQASCNFGDLDLATEADRFYSGSIRP